MSEVREPAVDGALAILLVEDDEGDALIVQEELELAGSRHAVTHVRTLADAHAHLTAARPDCVLLDLGLPDSRGFDGLAALQRLTDAAFVVLTGLADADQGITALSHGAQDYLVKGAVDGPLLLRAVRYAVERRAAERSTTALREAEIAALENARLERGLLPTPLVRDPAVRVHTASRPGRRSGVLGGDFYDAVETDDGRLLLLIGDVCGHSADEAALGASLRIAWRALVLSGVPTEETFTVLDRVLACERHDPTIFATALMLAVEPDHRTARAWVAGHPRPLLLGPGAAEQLAARAQPPLGTGFVTRWDASALTLPASWSLLLFTDGLYEGFDDPHGGGERRLGETGLARLVDAQPPRDRDDLLGLVAAVEERNGGPLTDDVAALLVSVG